MAVGDKDLRKNIIEEHTWQILKDIVGVLNCFKQATDLVAWHKYPTIYSAVPIYNFLLDMLEDNDQNRQNIIHLAIRAAIDKLQKYYSKTDEPIYYIGVGKLSEMFELNLLNIF